MNKKGFTLIELLAVIVILSIIALIAVPLILNIIEKARKEAFKNNIHGIVKSAELYYQMRLLEGDAGYTKQSITKGESSELTFKGKIPDHGNVYITATGQIGIYMYDNDLKMCVVKQYDSSDIIVSEDTTLEACEGAIEAPILLSDIVQIGDYVDYKTGFWSETIEYSTLTELGDFGGYVTGESIEQGRVCENEGELLLDRFGWRVIDVDNDNVTLVHAGTPECYRNAWGRALESIDILLNRDYSIYLNPNYASEAGILTKELIEKVYGGIVESGMGFYTTGLEVLKSGSRYWIPSPEGENNMLYVQPGGYVGGIGNYTYGIRPVVKLKKGMLSTSGIGTIDEPYTIQTDFSPIVNHNKNGVIIGYWQNWNGDINLKLRDVPNYYDIISIATAGTLPGQPDGTISFSLDQYLSSRLGGYNEEDFKNDIKTMQLKGKKVLLSVGGSNNDIIINSLDSVENFVRDIVNIIEDYQLDGIDVNIENFIYPEYLSQALREIYNYFAEKIIITLTPETVDFKVDKNGNLSGKYYEVFQEVKDTVYMVSMQFYNSGTQYGLDGEIYEPGTTDFITALSVILLENGLDPEKLSIGTNYNNTKRGYMEPGGIVNAYQSLLKGGQTLNGVYVLPRSYSKLGGYMLWSINGDYGLDNKFSRKYYESLID